MSTPEGLITERGKALLVPSSLSALCSRGVPKTLFLEKTMLDSFHKYPLFPDLLENQRRSIKFFWEKGILDELELFSTIIGYQKEKTGIQTHGDQKPFKKKQNE